MHECVLLECVLILPLKDVFIDNVERQEFITYFNFYVLALLHFCLLFLIFSLMYFSLFFVYTRCLKMVGQFFFNMPLPDEIHM